MKNSFIAIAAISNKRRALGNKNELLWKIPGDLPRFKEMTTGHPIIMGYNTYLSLPNSLPNRTNIVMTLESGVEIEGAVVVNAVEEALSAAKSAPGSEEIYIIGGGMIYEALLPFTNELDLTLVEDEPEADVFFPEYSEFTEIVAEEAHPESEPPFRRVTLRRPKYI